MRNSHWMESFNCGVLLEDVPFFSSLFLFLSISLFFLRSKENLWKIWILNALVTNITRLRTTRSKELQIKIVHRTVYKYNCKILSLQSLQKAIKNYFSFPFPIKQNMAIDYWKECFMWLVKVISLLREHTVYLM